jgi:hypothetical protein
MNEKHKSTYCNAASTTEQQKAISVEEKFDAVKLAGKK